MFAVQAAPYLPADLPSRSAPMVCEVSPSPPEIAFHFADAIAPAPPRGALARATPPAAAPWQPSVPALPRERAAVLTALCVTVLAAWLQQRLLSCLAAFATVMLSLGEGSMAPGAAGSVGAMYLLSAVAMRSHQKSRVSQVLLWAQLAGLTAFSLRYVPGFARKVWPDALQLRIDGSAFSPSYNLDKALAASAVLTFANIPRAFGKGWKASAAAWRAAVGPTVGIIAVMMLPALLSGHVHFDPLAHPLWPLWLVHNLLLVTVPEETLFRGILPLALQRLPVFASAPPWLVLGATSVLFGVSHMGGGYTYLALSALAGVGYGLAAQKTGGLSGSVAAHVALNTVHFFLFTYPAVR